MYHSESQIYSPIRNARACRDRCVRTAFTLFELVLVLVILVVLFGMAIPTFSAMTREQKGREGVHAVRASLYTTRQTAIDSGIAVRWNSVAGTTLESDGPLLFYPNGTATDARIDVLKDNLNIAAIYVVGSTGAIVPRDADQ